jgi:hypothetical protein
MTMFRLLRRRATSPRPEFRFFSSLTRLTVAVAAAAALGACAKPATVPAMVPDVAGLASAASPFRSAITIGVVSGGRGSAKLWTAHVGNAEFQEALVRALTDAGLAAAQGGRYRLDADLQKLEEPFAGFAMTVEATIAYRLTDTTNGAVIYQNTVTTPATATMDDALDGLARLRIANERAVRANLRRLVEELSALPRR